jgi:hypothetical protein
MRTINVEVTGITPLLMNKYDVQAELDRMKGKRINKTYEPTEEAEKSAYRSSEDKKTLIIPSIMIYASMLNASSFHKIGKRSAKSILAGSIKIEPAEIPILDFKGKPIIKYMIDTRPVVIQRRSKVLKSRARVDEWKAVFNIVYYEEQIGDPDIIRKVLSEAGQRIGIMDFRPTKSGGFGTFKITRFEVEE